jgi:hypothetical protein
MGKYEALCVFLQMTTGNEITLSFKQIEYLIDDKLPSSAYNHKAWWCSSGHPHAQTWEKSGYVATDVAVSQAIEIMKFTKKEL